MKYIMYLFILDANTKPDKKELLNIIATELGQTWEQASIIILLEIYKFLYCI